MKILIATSESKPLCKTGGLADVCYALSKELNENKDISCDIILPYYKVIKDKNFEVSKFLSFTVYTNYQNVDTNIYLYKVGKINYYLVEQTRFFGRDNLYGYLDDALRFASFSLAVVQFLKLTNKYDIIQCNDWHTGMIPLLVKVNSLRVKSLFTIHNPSYQGYADPSALKDFFSLDISYYNNGLTRFNNSLSYLKSGIIIADKVSTVSKTHRNELLTQFENYNGLPYILKLREDNFVGITNGLDEDEFSPNTDKLLPFKYSNNNYKSAKSENRKALEKEFSIASKEKYISYCFISRLTAQKGVENILEAAKVLSITNSKLFILGSGEDKYVNQIYDLKRLFPNTVYFYNGYSDRIAHLLYASCDYFLMPSYFEPCGIGQLAALRYGTIPICSNVGGLNDTINTKRETQNGYLYDSRNKNEFLYYIIKASNDSDEHRELLIQNAMKFDSTWHQPVKEYVKLFKEMLEHVQKY